MNKINKNKISQVNEFVLKKEKFFIWGGLLTILFLFISYSFLMAISMATNFSLVQGEEELIKVSSENSNLDLKFLKQKEKISKEFSSKLVVIRNVEYVDSSFEKLVFTNN